MKDSWGLTIEIGDWLLVETTSKRTRFVKIERASDKGTWWITMLPRVKSEQIAHNVLLLKSERVHTTKTYVDDAVETYLCITDKFQHPPIISITLAEYST